MSRPKRLIRLKEHRPLEYCVLTPPSNYLELRPSLDASKSYVKHVDKDGFLESGNFIDEEKKIFLVGGSFVENMYTDIDNRIHSVLERRLFENGACYKVFNAGVSGATSLNIFNLILNKIVVYKPDAIVFFIPVNDGYVYEMNNKFWNKSPKFSTLTDKEQDVFKDHINLETEQFIESKLLVDLTMQLCNSIKCKLFFGSTPSLENLDGHYVIDKGSYQNALDIRKRMNQEIRKYVTDKGYGFLDLQSKYAHSKALFFDDAHTNAQGSKLVAEDIFNLISPSIELLNEKIKLNEIEFFKEIELNNVSVHTQVIEIPENQEIISSVLSYEIAEDSIAKEYSALYTFNSQEKYSINNTKLRYSDVLKKNYTYIRTSENMNVSFAHKIIIPKGVKSFDLGFRSWGTGVKVILRNVRFRIFLREIAKNSNLINYLGHCSSFSLADLDDKFTEGVNNVEVGNYIFQTHYKKGQNNKLIILLNGAVRDRTTVTLPVFQRHSWSKDIEDHVLNIDDPTLYLNDNLRVGWYYGKASDPLINEMKKLVLKISEHLRIEIKDIVLYGSSGGGFAALNIASYIGEDIKAVAINPQINLNKYAVEGAVKLFFETCIPVKARPEISLIKSLSRKHPQCYCLIYQNRLDVHHYKIHFKPLLDALNLSDNMSNGYFQSIVFEDERGHVGESREMFPILLKKVREMDKQVENS